MDPWLSLAWTPGFDDSYETIINVGLHQTHVITEMQRDSGYAEPPCTAIKALVILLCWSAKGASSTLAPKVTTQKSTRALRTAVTTGTTASIQCHDRECGLFVDN